MDNHTKEQRTKNMKAIKNKDSIIELKLREALWNKGLRYQKNCKDIPGKPDLVFKSKKIAIFCDSEYWHGYDWENKKKEIKSNQEFWIKKIEGNMKRDIEVNELLKKDNWTVLRFWGKEILKNLENCVEKITAVYNEKSIIKKIKKI